MTVGYFSAGLMDRLDDSGSLEGVKSGSTEPLEEGFLLIPG